MIPERLREALLSPNEKDDLAPLLRLDDSSEPLCTLVDAGDGVGVGIEGADLGHVEEEVLTRRPADRMRDVDREADGAAGEELGGGEAGRGKKTGGRGGGVEVVGRCEGGRQRQGGRRRRVLLAVEAPLTRHPERLARFVEGSRRIRAGLSSVLRVVAVALLAVEDADVLTAPP